MFWFPSSNGAGVRVYTWIHIGVKHLDVLCSRRCSWDLSSPFISSLWVQKTCVSMNSGRKLMLSVSCGKSKKSLWKSCGIADWWHDLDLGYPRVGSSFLWSPRKTHFPPGREWFLEGDSVCCFLGSGAANAAAPVGCEPQWQRFLLPHLVHTVSGFVKKQFWRNCWYLEDSWLDVLVVLQLQDLWFIITYVRYWWLQGSYSGKQLNALFHLCLFKKPSEQIGPIKQPWGWGTLTWAWKLRTSCFSTGNSSHIPPERKEISVFAAGWRVHQQCCDPTVPKQ